jgi:hypothetical protein
MKNTHSVSLLLSSILLASTVLAQNPSPTGSSPASDPVAAARIPYTQDERESSSKPSSANGETSGENKILAQFSRPQFGPPYAMRPPMGRYPAAWSRPGWYGPGSHPSAKGALIGLLVGGGLGAALGAAKQPAANRGTNAALGGLIIGGIGAAFGSAIAAFPGFPHARNRTWGGDAYGELGSHPKARAATREASSQPTSPGAPAVTDRPATAQ